MNRALTTSLALLLLGGATGARSVAAADRFRFEPSVSAGDVYEVAERLSFELNSSSDTEQSSPTNPFRYEIVSRSHREVLTARNGRATELRVTYLVSRFTFDFGGEKAESKFYPVGRTFVVRKRGGKTEVTADEGKLDKLTRKLVANELNEVGPLHFPSVDLAPGDNWDVPGDRTAAPGTPQVGQTRAQLVGVHEERGEQYAQFKIEQLTDFSSVPGPFFGIDSAKLSGTVKGELRYLVGRQRPLEMELSGPFNVTGTTMKDGVEVPVTLTGKGQQSYRETWIKVAGQPVVETTSSIAR